MLSISDAFNFVSSPKGMFVSRNESRKLVAGALAKLQFSREILFLIVVPFIDAFL